MKNSDAEVIVYPNIICNIRKESHRCQPNYLFTLLLVFFGASDVDSTLCKCVDMLS